MSIDMRFEAGVIHTMGMAEHKLPELEICNVPRFLVPEARRILNKVAQYMLSGKPVQLGDTMAIGTDDVCVEFKPSTVEGRWCLAER